MNRYRTTYVCDHEGRPVPTNESKIWGPFLMNMEKRRVERTVFRFRGVPVEVSTVFLVFNHQYDPYDERPVLWETMIFSRSKRVDQYQERYKSLEEARAGHRTAIGEALLLLRIHPQNTRIRKVLARRKRELTNT